MTEHSIALTPEARQTLDEMEAAAASTRYNVHDRLMEHARPAEGWADDYDGYAAACEHARTVGEAAELEAWRSLAHVLAQVLRLGGRITKDGHASLFGSSFIAYGVIYREASNGAREWSTHS